MLDNCKARSPQNDNTFWYIDELKKQCVLVDRQHYKTPEDGIVAQKLVSGKKKVYGRNSSKSVTLDLKNQD